MELKKFLVSFTRYEEAGLMKTIHKTGESLERNLLHEIISEINSKVNGYHRNNGMGIIRKTYSCDYPSKIILRYSKRIRLSVLIFH